jgi:hypothetical protein
VRWSAIGLGAKFARNRMRLVDNSRYGQHAPITL